MLYIHFLAVGLITSAIAAPGTEKRTIPTVNLPNAQVVGSSLVGIDSFGGIPYAQPPVGNLRLKPPQPISSSLGTVLATGIPRACPQFTAQTNTSFLPANVATALLNSPLFQTATNAGEDCLIVNVQRPSTATSSSKLPVVFWIFGGGFEFGSTQAYDASNLILTSMRQSKPVIYVSVNYRVGGFGFLPGSQILADGSSNLGLLDQRLALQWVADNIGFFGGDPSKVTIWGESAGSISVYDQMALYGGNNTYKGKSLFRAAIMDSGSIVPADPVNCPKGQAIYNTVVTNAGCSSVSDTLSCLRNVSYTTFLNAANSVPALFSYNSLALSYLPRPDGKVLPDSPDVSIAEGSYAKVPLIIGDQEDEGTIFALPLSNITSTDEIVDYLHSLYYQSTSPDQIRTLVDTYPDDNGVSGSPFNTGSINNLYPEYKRISAILGDVTFTLMRRVFLGFYGMNGVPSWSYLARYGSTVPIVGTYHGSDVPVAYGVAGIPTASIQTYYLNFINNMDPNSNLAPSSSTLPGTIVGTLPIASTLIPYWPQWNSTGVTGASSGNGGTLLSFGAAANTIDSDGFRESSFDALRELVDGGSVRI